MRNFNALSPYYTAVDNTLEQYVPLPFQEMMAASNAIYQRAEENQNQVFAADNLIANVEALSPEHRNYVQGRGQSFRQESSALLDQYGGNAADPEFIRKSRQLIRQYANDNNFKTIGSANEQLRMNDRIAREMRAKGQLYTRPQFSGVDANGNLTDQVGEISLVNTLDKLRGEYEVAWKSMENNNRGTISNAANINRLNKRVMDSLANQSPEFQQLAAAYMEQGMSPQQAATQIQSDITGLQGQYGIRSERDNGYYSFQLALRQDARQAQSHAMNMRLMSQQLNPQQSTAPLKGNVIEGAISNVDLNKDKLDMVKNFRKNIDENGNLKAAKARNRTDSGNYVTAGSPTSMSPGQPFQSNAGRSQGRTSMEALNYMRDELGWAKSGRGSGSAKQVADAYEQLLRNDNMAPTVYVPSNPTVYNNLDKQFGNNMSGATYYIDGKQKHADKDDIIKQLEDSKAFLGISAGKTSQGSPDGALKYRAYVDKKPVIVEVPLPSAMRTMIGENIKFGKLIQSNIDNKGIKSNILRGDTDLVQVIGQDYFAPRRTANGLRFAKINPKMDNNGRMTDFDFSRDGNNQLQYIPDQLIQQKLHSEYNALDNLLEYQYK